MPRAPQVRHRVSRFQGAKPPSIPAAVARHGATTEPAAASPWVRTNEPLLWLGGAGHETWWNAEYWFDCLKRVSDRPHYVLQYTLAGAAFYERSRERWLITSGMAFLDRIPGDFRYGYPAESRVPYELIFVSLTGPAAEALCQQIIGGFGNVVRFGLDSPVQAMLASIAHQHAAGTLRDRYQISGRLYQLLMAVLSSLKASQLATSPLVGDALALVDQRSPDHRFNVMALARVLDCSREHLTRQFRAATGVSAGDYITQHRLSLAARYLRQGDDKLNAVAGRCGFASANYLCRAFRKRYGITPAQFRRTPWVVTE